MRWTDDHLDELLRRANPSGPEQPPTAEDWARLNRIMAEQSVTVRSRIRSAAIAVGHALTGGRSVSKRARVAWEVAWALPIIGLIAAGALALGPLTASPAYADTPPVLEVAPIGSSSDTVIRDSISKLQSAPASVPVRDAQVVRWKLRNDGEDAPVIIPEWQRWVWHGDGTGHLESSAGAPYSVTSDGQIVEPVGPAPTEGEALDPQVSTGYGHFPEPPPSDADALRVYLRAHAQLADDADALAIWGAISALRDEWSLTAAQQAAALELLDGTGALRVLGTVTDRFGRAGIAMQLTSDDRPEFAATIVLSRTSRQIIAADIVYLGGVDRLDVPANSVIEYSVWLQR